MNTQKLQGASHEKGGIHIEAEGGERIFSIEDTNNIEKLASSNNFDQLGKFIKKAMKIQDSRPLDYKGIADQGTKVFDAVDNKLPFNLSEAEHNILNQYAAYNNSLTPNMLKSNIARTIVAKMGAAIPNVPQQTITNNPKHAALRNNNPGNIMYYQVHNGKQSTTPSGYAQYLIDQDYDIEPGSKNNHGQFIKFNNLDDGMSAKLNFWPFIASSKTYGGQPVDGMTLDEALKLYSKDYGANELGLEEHADTEIKDITQDVWNEVSGNQIKNEDHVLYNHIFGQGTKPIDIDYSQYSLTPTSSTGQQMVTPTNPWQTQGEEQNIFAPDDNQQQITGTLPSEPANQSEEKQKEILISKLKGDRQVKLDQLKKDLKKAEKAYLNAGYGRTDELATYQMLKRKKKKLENEIAYIDNPIDSSDEGKAYLNITADDRKLADEMLKEGFNDLYWDNGKQGGNKITRRSNDDKKDTKDLYQHIRKKISESDAFKNKNLSQEDSDFLLDALTNDAFLKIDRDDHEAAIEKILGITDKGWKDSVLEDVLEDGNFHDNIKASSNNESFNTFRDTYLNKFSGKPSQQELIQSLNIPVADTQGMTSAGTILDPTKPSGQQINLAPQSVQAGASGTGAGTGTTGADTDPTKQDIIDKIEAYDEESNITGEAKTTYEDLFSDERTSGQKAKDFLLDNALNIGEMIGGIAGSGENLPRFMISDQLIEHAQTLNQKAQTGLSAEEKSLMLREAVDAEQSAMNMLSKSGLSSGQILGIAPQIQEQKQEQKLKIEILDQQTQERNQQQSLAMDKYLGDLQYQTQFQPDYQEAMQRQQGAIGMAQSGMQGIQGNLMYEKQFGKGSPYAAMQQVTMQNILEDVRSKEMSESKAIGQADWLDQQDENKKSTIAAIQQMSQDDWDKFDKSSINKMIQQFNPQTP